MSGKRPRLEWSNGSAGPVLSAEEAAIRDLLGGDANALSWQDAALCAQTDPEVFFPEKCGSTRDAKQVCRRCPVRAQCLEYALATDQRFGIWGGLSERERRKIKTPAPFPRAITAHEMERVTALRGLGLSFQEIAERMGTTERRVSIVARKTRELGRAA